MEQYFDRFNRTVDGCTRLKEFIRENMSFGTEHCLDNNDVRVGILHGDIIVTWVVPHQVAQLILRGLRQVLHRAACTDGPVGPVPC